jgi:serine/threonine protein kinase
VDFGIATKNAGATDLTSRGDVLGTPHYLSPEQACARPLDGRSDLYSLGVMLFEMLTGRRPFQAKDAVTLAHKHVNEPLPRLPAELAQYQELVDCLTAKRPEDRFASAAALLAHLETNPLSLRARAAELAFAGHEGDVSQSQGRPRDALDGPSAHKIDARQGSASSIGRPNQHSPAIDHTRVLDVQGTLSRYGGDAAQLGHVARTFTRTGPIFLILLTDALNDSNLQFVHEAAHLLKDAVASIEAPAVSHALSQLQTSAKERDGRRAASAFVITRHLVTRLISELMQTVRA